MARKNVLIIDESDLFRDYLKSRISASGAEVETAINGLDGIVKMRNGLPDLVILDYNLTRKSCKEVLEEKNRNPNTASIPVVLTAQKFGPKSFEPEVRDVREAVASWPNEEPRKDALEVVDLYLAGKAVPE